MKATDLYLPVMLFIMLYKKVLTFESGDDTCGVACFFGVLKKQILIFFLLYVGTVGIESVLCFYRNALISCHQDNPPPGSYEVSHSYDSTQGT